MRTALISDIHGELERLRSTLREIDSLGCDRIICLGDLVEGGEEDDEVIRLIRARRIRCVLGNHDEWYRYGQEETPESAFLRRRPERIEEGRVVFTHISPLPGERSITSTPQAFNVFEETDQWLAFVGHTHVPRIFAARSKTVGAARLIGFQYGSPLLLDRADRYIVCVGAIGDGRDDDQAPRFAIWDEGRLTIEMRRVDGA